MTQTVPLVAIDLELAGGDGPRQLTGFQEFPRGDLEQVLWIKDRPLLIDKGQVVEIEDEDPAVVFLQLAYQPVVTAHIVLVLRRPDPKDLFCIPVKSLF